MGLLRKIQTWWRGDLDPSAHAQAEKVRDEVDTVKASVPGPNVWGGMHQREKDDRPPN
jgi:hypothetical protein